MSAEAIAQCQDSLRGYVNRLTSCDSSGFSVTDRINRAMLRLLEAQISESVRAQRDSVR